MIPDHEILQVLDGTYDITGDLLNELWKAGYSRAVIEKQPYHKITAYYKGEEPEDKWQSDAYFHGFGVPLWRIMRQFKIDWGAGNGNHEKKSHDHQYQLPKYLTIEAGEYENPSDQNR